MAKAKDKKKYRLADSAKMMQGVPQSGGCRYVNLPKNVRLAQLKGAMIYVKDCIPYELSKVSERFLATKKQGFKAGDLWWFRVVGVHFQVGPTNEQVICPAVNFGEPCPICERKDQKQAQLRTTPGMDTKENWKAMVGPLRPKDQALILMRDVTNPQGLELSATSPRNFLDQIVGKINGASPKKIDKFRNHWHPGGDGLSMRIATKDEKMSSENRTYVWMDVNDFEEREHEIPDSVYESPVKLDDLLIVQSYDEIKKLFEAGVPVDTDGRASAKKNKDEDDDEDDEEDDEEDDDTDDDDDDEEDDEDDDDDDEEESETESDEDDDSIAKGDRVTGIYKKKKFTGKVESVNEDKGVATVKTDDGEKRVMDLDELTVVEDDDDDDDSDDDDDEPLSDDDDDDTDDDSDEDDESEDDEDDDDDDDEEEEEEEEKPRRKPAAKKTGRGKK